MDAGKEEQGAGAGSGAGARQTPRPEQNPEAPGTGGSKLLEKTRSKSSSRKSHEEEARSTLNAALYSAGVQEAARKVLVHLGITREILKRASMRWVLDCLADADVVLTQREMQQLQIGVTAFSAKILLDTVEVHGWGGCQGRSRRSC